MITITIKNYSFVISAPYAEGTVLTRGEAQALNGLRAENVRNNVARAVGKAQDSKLPGELLDKDELAELQVMITKYDQNYQFMEREPRQGPRRSSLDAEIVQVALERAQAQARMTGKDLAPEDEAEAVELFSGLVEVQEEARRRLAERARIASQGLDDL